MRELELVGRVPAPVERVWALLTDHVGWQRWAGVREVVLRQQGDPPPDGVGARRVVRQSGLAIEEEVTAFEPPRRIVLRVLEGAPLRDATSEIELSEAGEVTTVVWRFRFRPLLPLTGGLVERSLERRLTGILDRLARVAGSSGID